MTDQPEYKLYFYPSPNSLKVLIALEELGLCYEALSIDLAAGEQLTAEFAALNPNRKVPVLLVDGQPIFESVAILEFLAERHDRLLGQCEAQRWQIKQWLYWQAAAFGPMSGQAHHFRCFAPEFVPYAVRRYTDEMNRLYGVLDERLSNAEWVCADYSIADIGLWPWVRHHDWQGQTLKDFPAVSRWYSTMAKRPAVALAAARYPVQIIAPENYGLLLNQTAETLIKK